MTTTNPLRRFGGWAVWADYLQHEPTGYEITIGELERAAIDWPMHLADKRWFVAADFEQAQRFLLWLASDPGVAYAV